MAQPARLVRLGKLTLAGLLVCATPAFANSTNGAWGKVHKWPLIPLHSIVTKDGRVMTFGTDLKGGSLSGLYYDVWDPSKGFGPQSHMTLSNITRTDIFCAGMVNLPKSGDVLTVGGDDNLIGSNISNNEVTLFSPSQNRIDFGPSMSQQRWYPTATILANDEILIQGGRGNAGNGVSARTPEIFSPGGYAQTGTWRNLNGATNAWAYDNYSANNMPRWFYPRAWVAPNGKVFTTTGRAHFWIDPVGNGQIYNAGTLGGNFTSLNQSSSAAMYGLGKIMQVGGGTGAAASRQVVLIDINNGQAKFSIAPSAKLPRHWGNATILPDGRVLINGGSEYRQNLNTGIIGYKPEIWDPARLTSTLMKTGETRARLYHSTSTLLADGRVLSGGGGTPGPQKNLNAQPYSPPYLFSPAGGRIKRPKIVKVDKRLPYNSNVKLRFNAAGTGGVVRATLVKTPSVTHSFNMEQRFVELAMQKQGNEITFRTPATARLATPGFYYLFLIAKNGAPSIGRIVQLDRHFKKTKTPAKNLVSDSGFESVANIEKGLQVQLKSGAYFGGWEVISGAVSVINNWRAKLGQPKSIVKPQGRQIVDLKGGSLAGHLRQSVSGFVVGKTYRLQVLVAKHPTAIAGVARIQIGSLNQIVRSNQPANVRWDKRTFSFVANDETLELNLHGGGAVNCCGLLIDGLKIKQIN